MAEELLKLRREQAHEPRRVYELGVSLLKKGSYNGSDIYDVMEQVITASLEMGDIPFAIRLYDSLSARFPSSRRVERIKVLISVSLSEERTHLPKKEGTPHLPDLEVPSDSDVHVRFGGSRGAVDALVKGDTSDVNAHRLAVLFGEHNNNGCFDAYAADRRDVNRVSGNKVSGLVRYLTHFPSDVEAWKAAAEEYSALAKFEEALFCVEELIVMQPQCYGHYVGAGEILINLGGPVCAKRARKYFAQAANLNQMCPRAYLGLISACSYLAAGGSSANEDALKNSELLAMAKEKLSQLYDAAGSKDRKEFDIAF